MTPAPVLVQKFGGTSVSTPERRAQVVGHVQRAQQAGFRVAVVVSAMGRRGDPYATDTLLDLLRGDGGPVDPRDYDLVFGCGESIAVAVLCQALRRAGIPAQGLTGVQARIYTDGRHQQAEIVQIDTSRLQAVMERGEVPVITGAQGAAPDTLDVTILGRGGSDTSGVELGVALGAARVEIFTDVAGIATADPRLIPDAALLPHISYAAAHELARFGATIVHPRAIHAGWRAGIPIVVRSTFGSAPGTLVDGAPDARPIVALAALASLETLVLPAGDIDGALPAAWERDGFATLRDRATGRLVVGTTRERVAELRNDLDIAAIEPAAELHDRAWLSVVGEASALQAVLGDRAGLGTTVEFEERTERRVTFVIPEVDRVPSARRLHALAFQEPMPTSASLPATRPSRVTAQEV